MHECMNVWSARSTALPGGWVGCVKYINYCVEMDGGVYEDVWRRSVDGRDDDDAWSVFGCVGNEPKTAE